MAKQKVELEQVNNKLAGKDTFRVMKLTNRLEPKVGSTIDEVYVKDLIRKPGLTVVIVPEKV